MKHSILMIQFALLGLLLIPKCEAQIVGMVENIEKGDAILIDVSTKDTLAKSIISNHQFVFNLNYQVDSNKVLPAVVKCIQFDNQQSSAAPLAVGNEPIAISIGKDGFPSYSGTPLQDKFSAFVMRVSELDQQLNDRSAGVNADSLQNELGKRLEIFYLENRSGKLKEFAALIVSDFLNKKLIDPQDLLELKKICQDQIHLDANDKMICEGMDNYTQQWEGIKFLDFTGKNSNDSDLNLNELIGKKVIVLDFWATWCGPCLREMAELKNIYNQGKIEIVGISIDDHKGAWKSLLIRLNLPWLNIWDENKVIAKTYNVTSVPTKFIIDKKGIIVARNPEDIRAVIEKLE